MNSAYLHLALGLGLLVLVAAQVDLGKVAGCAGQLGPLDLALAIGVLCLQHLLKAKRWHLILASQGLGYGFGEALRMYWSALFIGVVTPGRLGELSRLVYLKQDGVRLGTGMAGVVVDRALDLVVMAAMVGGGAGTCLTTAMAGLPPAPERLVQLAAHLLPRQARRMMGEGWDDLVAGLRLFLAARREMAASIAMTLLSWGLYVQLVHTLVGAMGLNFTLGLCAFFLGASGLAALVPVSLAGIGTRDVLLVALAGMVGRPKEEGLVFSACILLLHVLTALVGAAGWLPGRRLRHRAGVAWPS